MVLKRRTSWRATVAAFVCLAELTSAAAYAQDIQPTAPILKVPDDLFAPTPIALGGATLEVGGSIRTEYDSNIYAQAFDEVDDVKLIFNPFVNIKRASGALDLSAHAEGDIRKYLSHDTESAAGGEITSTVAWKPTTADRLVLVGALRRLIEDRGEPEARTITSIGPRQISAGDLDLTYGHQGSRFGFSVRGTADRYRYDDAIDQDRNLDSYGFVGRGTMRLTPLLNGLIEGFINRRDFQLTGAEAEFNRDSNTYGSRIGIAVDPGGRLRGEAAVGVYRFDPVDQRIDGRTGVSAQVALIFQPLQRTAFTLDGFIGDAATYRTGAQSREDKRVRLGVQQELRHNVRWQVSVLYRQSRYFGTGITESTYGGSFEIEYLVNRWLIVGGTANYGDRECTAPLQEFNRLRVGLDVKVHY